MREISLVGRLLAASTEVGKQNNKQRNSVMIMYDNGDPKHSLNGINVYIGLEFGQWTHKNMETEPQKEPLHTHAPICFHQPGMAYRAKRHRMYITLAGIPNERHIAWHSKGRSLSRNVLNRGIAAPLILDQRKFRLY